MEEDWRTTGGLEEDWKKDWKTEWRTLHRRGMALCAACVLLALDMLSTVLFLLHDHYTKSTPRPAQRTGRPCYGS